MKSDSAFPLYFLYTSNRESIDGATRFQKLIFLAQEETELPEKYTFRPDRFGPFSPSLRSDLEALVEEGYINRSTRRNRYGQPRIEYGLTDKGYNLMRDLVQKMDNTRGLDIVQGIKRRYNNEPLPDLLRYVYGKYDDYMTVTELNVEALFDPDARSEFETVASDARNRETVASQLRPTPHTLWQMPKRETNAYFYYFTDATYSGEDSKFRQLDDELTLLGRHRKGIEVVFIDRDRYRMEHWRAFLDGLSIDSYPALLVAEAPIGIEDADQGTTEFVPNDVNYAKIENGIIQDNILSDPDDTRQFLNALFDAAFENELESQMRREKVVECLKIGTDKIGGILSLTVNGP